MERKIAAEKGRRTGIAAFCALRQSDAAGWTAVAAKLHFAPKKRHFAKKAPRFLPFGI